VLQLLVTANVVASSPILVTLMVEAIRSSETSVLTRVTRRDIPKDGILHRKSLFPLTVPPLRPKLKNSMRLKLGGAPNIPSNTLP
jgi:hypothetical protein